MSTLQTGVDDISPCPGRPPLEKRAKKIFRLVARGATGEEWARWLWVPLKHAAAAGDTDLFNEILEAGAHGSVERGGCYGRSLLEAAARGGSVEVVSTVLEKAVAPQPDVDVALFTASVWGMEAAGRRLIAAGAGVNFIHPIHKSTALHVAAHGGLEQLVNDLLQAGANTSLERREDDYRRTPLHIAAGEGHDGIVSALLQSGVDIDEIDAYGNSSLIWAAKGGHLAVVETLLAAGADVGIEGCMQEFLATTALSFAAELEHLAVMEAIISAGADVNAAVNAVLRAGVPALHCATSRGQVGAIDMLIKAGADIDVLGNHGKTPLLCAAEDSGFKAMWALLERGAAVNAEGPDETALHVICSYRHHGFETAVGHLLLKGADETALNEDGKTPAALLDLKMPMWPIAPPDEIQRAKALLARAPADRAWRRRSWLVLLRARAENERRSKCTKVGERGMAPSVRSNGAGVCDEGSEEAEAEEIGGGVSDVVDMLVRRASEGVFRTILGFL